MKSLPFFDKSPVESLQLCKEIFRGIQLKRLWILFRVQVTWSYIIQRWKMPFEDID